MPVTEEDLEAWARWVGLHFEPPLKETAVAVAYAVVRTVGVRPTLLRPETPMREITAWLQEAKDSGLASLEMVELLMLIEEETRCDLTDEFAETLEQRTFGEYVSHLHAHRRAA
jgi:acyl carrier protein